MDKAIVKIHNTYCILTYRGNEEYGLGFAIDYCKTWLNTQIYNNKAIILDELKYMLDADFDTDFEDDFNIIEIEGE